MRELPRQLSIDELSELFEGRTRLVERLAATEDPLVNADAVLAVMSEEEKVEALAAHPAIGHTSVTTFVALYALAICIYGGCFAMIPAYITDLFGSRHVTYIHGRLLSAWSVGVILSLLISSLRTYRIGHGASPSEVDAEFLYLAGVLLLIGLICNLLIRPLSSRHRASEGSFGDAAMAAQSVTEHGR